jgi:hypothetical protein
VLGAGQREAFAAAIHVLLESADLHRLLLAATSEFNGACGGDVDALPSTPRSDGAWRRNRPPRKRVRGDALLAMRIQCGDRGRHRAVRAGHSDLTKR